MRKQNDDKQKGKAPPATALTESRTPSISSWRSNPERIAWWQGVLDHPFGQELAAIVREFSPEIPTGDGIDGFAQALAIAKAHRETEGSLLGMIAGHNRLRNLLFKTLARLDLPPGRLRKPGQPAVDPHPAV